MIISDITKKDSRVISIQQAEMIAGKKLDRRRDYAFIRGEICSLVKWTDSCYGCFEGGEYMGLAHNYPYDNKAQCYIGSGCSECGYTGKRIREMWVPIHSLEIDKEIDREYRESNKCVKCGYCCKVAPCGYGSIKDGEKYCQYLKDIGDNKYDCSIYKYIKTQPGWKISPAFGTGCSSRIGNTARDNILSRASSGSSTIDNRGA